MTWNRSMMAVAASAPHLYDGNMSARGIFKMIADSLFRRSFPMLQPGDVAPDFSLENHRGEKVSLRELRGKNVVLWFFPKADTPG